MLYQSNGASVGQFSSRGNGPIGQVAMPMGAVQTTYELPSTMPRKEPSYVEDPRGAPISVKTCALASTGMVAVMALVPFIF